MRPVREMFKNLRWEKRGTFGWVAIVNSPFGLWPEEDDNFSLRLRCGVSALALSAMVIQSVYDLYLNCVEMVHNSGTLFSAIYGLIGLSKLICYYKHRDLLRTNVESAVDDWSKEDSRRAISIMSICRGFYEKFMIFYIALGCCATFLYSLVTVVMASDVTITVTNVKEAQNEDVTTMLRPKFQVTGACSFGNVSHRPTYWSIVVVQFFQSLVALGANLGPDGIFLAITSHLCAQFEILKIKFTDCLKQRDPTETSERLSGLVCRHKYLLKLAKQLETAFSIIVFTQIVMNLVILDVAGVNVLVLLKRREVLNIITNATIIQIVLAQSFLYSYIGDKLSSQGDDIALSVYASEWYSMPSRVSKNAMLVMTRTRLPIGISAGNFFKMSRSTFTDMIKTAASYLSVLRIKIIQDA